MKKVVKKIAAVGMAATTTMGLLACGTSTTTSSNNSTTEITKPDHIKVMADTTIVTEANGGQSFYDQLAEATGLDIEWIRPDHSSYYDSVSNAFNSDDQMPDVVNLSSDYYAVYASNGFLWDMTDSWNSSDTKNSGRLVDGAQSIIDSAVVCGEDGTKALYGLPTSRGNGCVTYIKKTWLDAAGIDVSDVEGVTMDFDTYYGYLKQMAAAKGHYVISAPGFISAETPYTNYLPEFYQDAHYTFYQNSSGEYVDGFSEQAMKDALERIQTAVEDGVIDKETVNNSTANCRDKFYSTDESTESGVFTYWAGDWANTLKVNLEAKGLDGELIEINPIKELGAYTERLSTVWAITSTATNPEGIFKYFIDTMNDGGTVQMLWTYGAKGVHWDNVAETVTVQGQEDSPTTYSEGEFHFLPSVEKPTTLQTKNYIGALGGISEFIDGNPGDSAVTEVAKESAEFFAEYSEVDTALPATEVLSDNIGDINTSRQYVIAQVALGTMTVDEGMAYYEQSVGSAITEVLKSLNDL